MKKIFKTSLAVALSVCMAAAMTACGGSGSASSSESAPTDSGAAAEGTEASAGGAIKIGGSGPLTGPAAVYGQAVKNAAEIAVEEVNAKGGLQFELNMQDDAHDPEKAVTAYGVLKDWGMQASLATVTSAPGAAVSPSYAEDKIFAITPSGSSTSVIYADPDNLSGAFGNVFQMCFTDPNQGTASADYISAHPELGTKVGIIYKNDDNYSKGIFDTFMAEAAAKGLNVVYSEGTFDDSNAQDFTVQLGKAQEAGADILFLPIYYDPASLILTQANGMGYKPTFFGVDGMDGILGLEGFDTSLAEGVYLLTPFSADATDELTVNFVNKYKEKFGEVPNQFAADAYDCVYAIAQACEAAGVTADMSSEEICTKLVEQFTTMTFSGLTGSEMKWNANGEVTKSPKAVVIKDGVYVGVED